MMLGILASAIRRGIEEPPTEAGIQFLGATTRSKPLEDTTTTQFVFPLPAGTKIGDTLVLWLQGYQYDPDHTGWSPALLDDGVTQVWGYRTRQVADLSDIVVAAGSSRCVAVLWAFSGAGSAPVLKRAGTFQSINTPSGTHPAGPTLPAGAKFVLDIVSSPSTGASADVTTPYPAGLVLTKYTPSTLGTSQTHSAGMAVGTSVEGEYTPPATTWNVTVNMVSNRWCLYAG